MQVKRLLRHFRSKKLTYEELTKEELENLTYYEVLNVPQNANKNQIRKAYLLLAKKQHPDLKHNPSTEFTYIVQAYQTLMDDQQRAVYDDSLVNPKDYYKVGVGRFRVSVKWLFSFSILGILAALAVQEEELDPEACPTNHMVRKLGLENIAETEEPPETSEIVWKKLPKKSEGASLPSPSKPIFAKKDSKKLQKTQESSQKLLPKDRSFKADSSST